MDSFGRVMEVLFYTLGCIVFILYIVEHIR